MSTHGDDGGGGTGAGDDSVFNNDGNGGDSNTTDDGRNSGRPDETTTTTTGSSSSSSAAAVAASCNNNTTSSFLAVSHSRFFQQLTNKKQQQGRGGGNNRRIAARARAPPPKKVQDKMQIRVCAGQDLSSMLLHASSRKKNNSGSVFRHVKYLTIYNCGEHVDGAVIGNILDQCHCTKAATTMSSNDDNDNSKLPSVASSVAEETSKEEETELLLSSSSSVLTSIVIERRDNDWDSPFTKLYLNHGDDLRIGKSLLIMVPNHFSSLQHFTITGLVPTSSSTLGVSLFHLSYIVSALVKLPNIKTIKLGADLSSLSSSSSTSSSLSYHSVTYSNGISSSSSNNNIDDDTNDFRNSTNYYFTHYTLRSLVQKESLQSLSLLGIFPETIEYTQVLQEAYIKNGCTIHIFIYFQSINNSKSSSSSYNRSSSSSPLSLSHSSTTTTSSNNNNPKRSRFAYYIREIMELNQLGRIHVRDTNNPYELLDLLLHANGKKRRSRKKNTNTSFFLSSQNHQPSLLSSLPPSLDSLYILIRENPWICTSKDDNVDDDTKTKRRKKENRFLSRIKRQIFRRW